MSSMNWALNACKNYKVESTLSEKEFNKSGELKKTASSIFQSSRTLFKYGWNKDKNFFREVWEEATGKDIELHEMTSRDLKKFKWELKDREKWIDKGFGASSHLKVLEANLKRIPGGRDLRRTINNIVAYHRQHVRVNTNRITNVVDQVKSLSKTYNVDIRKLETLETQLQKSNTVSEQNQALNAIKDFLGTVNSEGTRKTAGDLFLSIRDVMENTPVDQLRRTDPTTGNMDKQWNTKDLESFRVIRDNWMDMRKDLVGVLKNALRSEKRLIANIDRTEGGARRLTEYLDRIEQYIDNLEFRESSTGKGRKYGLDGREIHEFGLDGKKLWELNSELGYMPHYLLTIAKDLKTFSDYAHDVTDRRTAFDVFKDQINLWESGQGVLSRVRSRSDINQEYYSRNPFLFMSKYLHEVSAYNHSNAIKESLQGVMNSFFKPAMRNAEKLSEADHASVEMFIDQASKVITTMSEATINTGHKPNSWGDKMTRFLTSYQFFRTMGFNMRSAIRNSGQQLIERVHLGYGARGAAKQYLLDTDKNVQMEYQATRHGILWTRDAAFLSKLNKAYHDAALEGTKGTTEQSSLLPGLREVVDSAGNKTIEMYDVSMTDRIVEMVESVSSKSAVLHTMVENMNRFGTFRVGYSLAHENLSKSPVWYIEQQMKMPLGTSTREQRMQWIDRMSGDLAYNVVTDVHFEYGAHEKAPIMRTKGGKVLMQFQHYRFELANLQFNWIKKGLRDVRAGDIWKGQHSRQMIRMAMTYSIIGALTTATGIGFTNLLANDNYEYLKNHYDFYTAERDENGELTEEGLKQVEEATYGAGAWSDFGPSVGLLLEIGDVSNMFQPNQNAWLPMLTAADSGQNITVDEEDRSQKMMRLFNAQATRTWHHTADAMFNRNWSKTFFIETGLYTDWDTTKKSDELFQYLRDVTGFGSSQKLRYRNMRDTGRSSTFTPSSRGRGRQSTFDQPLR